MILGWLRLEPVSVHLLGLPSTHYGRKERNGSLGSVQWHLKICCTLFAV